MTDKGKVIVVGVQDGLITEDGLGSKVFGSLEEALQEFPDLDLDNHSKRFTKAFPQARDGISYRFETWPANKLYST